jgi:hypothetical protein
VFGASRAQYAICDRATGSNDDHSSKSNLSQEVEGEASAPKESRAARKKVLLRGPPSRSTQ